MVTPTKDRQDMQRLIRLILDTPIHSTGGKKGQKQVELSEGMTLDDLKGQNTDVKTRMLTVQALSACNGDKAAAEFLMKYGGLEPIKEQTVTLEPPTFVDDLGDDDLGEPIEIEKSKDDEAILRDAVIYNDPDESA